MEKMLCHLNAVEKRPNLLNLLFLLDLVFVDGRVFFRPIVRLISLLKNVRPGGTTLQAKSNIPINVEAPAALLTFCLEIF